MQPTRASQRAFRSCGSSAALGVTVTSEGLRRGKTKRFAQQRFPQHAVQDRIGRATRITVGKERLVGIVHLEQYRPLVQNLTLLCRFVALSCALLRTVHKTTHRSPNGSWCGDALW